MQHKRLRATQVRLDPTNPRLPDGTTSDLEAINRLLDEGYTQMLALAKDFLAVGESNPSELPIVTKEGSKYLVLEGNRRFAVLKLLANPTLAEDASRRAAFKRLADKGGNPPKTILCAVVARREDAEHWLVLRHTGVNQGVGVKPWTTEQQATHRTRAGASVDSGTVRSLTIAEELQEAYTHDADLVEVIRKVRNTKLTNIGRFFASDVMTRLHLGLRDGSGLHVRDRILTARHSADALHPFFDWALRYIDDNSVDAYKNANIRRTLLDEHDDLIPDLVDVDGAVSTRLADNPFGSAGTGTTGDADDGDSKEDDASDEDGSQSAGSGEADAARTTSDSGQQGGNAGAAGSTDTGGTGSRGKNEARPEKYLFADLKLGHLERRTQDLLREARALVIEESPGIACVMARVLVELAVSEPKVLAWTGANESDTLQKKITKCLRVLDPDLDKPMKADASLAPAYLDTRDGLGIRYLHQFVHNPQARPDPHLARRFSAVWRPVLVAINTRNA